MCVEYASSVTNDAAKILKVLRERFTEIENPSRLEKSLLEGAAKEYREDKSSHAGRYPFELLQNAHDAHSKGEDRSGTAWFVWTESALLVGDSGVGFTVKDVEDVSEQDNLGYDIRCKIDDEIRFIEVKSTRSTTDAFRLTQSEKEALEEFGDQFWVVFVTNVFEDQAGPRQVEIIRGLHDYVTSFIEVHKNPDHQVARKTWELCEPEILEI